MRGFDKWRRKPAAARRKRRSQGRKNSGPAAAARRKAAIDRGLTGDKVPGFDPAAAPLGTDAEAAGAPPVASDRAAASRGARAPIRRAWRPIRAAPTGAAIACRTSGLAGDRVAVLIAVAVIVAVLFAWS